jgi:hypothetical protein
VLVDVELLVEVEVLVDVELDEVELDEVDVVDEVEVVLDVDVVVVGQMQPLEQGWPLVQVAVVEPGPGSQTSPSFACNVPSPQKVQSVRQSLWPAGALGGNAGPSQVSPEVAWIIPSPQIVHWSVVPGARHVLASREGFPTQVGH